MTTELTFPHWLGKAYGGRQREFFVDLIFSGGNGVAEVDDEWFAHAMPDESLGFPVRLMPVEEMIWSKAFLMERERFDGADVLHLIRARQGDIDWPRLVCRFGEHWRVLLLAPCCLRYVYPNEPGRNTSSTAARTRQRGAAKRRRRDAALPRAAAVARAISGRRTSWNYVDAREVPIGAMTPEEIDIWTKAIESGH